MTKYSKINGDLIKLALRGEFDVIVHGCNCQNQMGAGIAPQMAKAFGCDSFPLERPEYKGDVNKLGQIDWKCEAYATGPDESNITEFALAVVNAYTQYNYGKNHSDGDKKPLDYEALTLCLRKVNKVFKGRHIGLPQIGCGLAGGDWNIVESIIRKELKDCKVTVVIFK